MSGRAHVALAGRAISSPALTLPIVDDCTPASAPRTGSSSYLGPVSPQAELKVALRLASWLVKGAVRQHDGVLLVKEQRERGGRVLGTGKMGMRWLAAGSSHSRRHGHAAAPAGAGRKQHLRAAAMQASRSQLAGASSHWQCPASFGAAPTLAVPATAIGGREVALRVESCCLWDHSTKAASPCSVDPVNTQVQLPRSSTHAVASDCGCGVKHGVQGAASKGGGAAAQQ